MIIVVVVSLLVLWVSSQELSSESCNAPEETIHLAGFSPDGYFSRARDRLVQYPNVFVAPQIQQFPNKKAYHAWLSGFLFPFNLSHTSSTLLWLENPTHIIGDSETLEEYIKMHVANRDSPYFSIRDFSISQTRKSSELWKTEAHQAVQCKNDAQSEFYVILMRDWYPAGFHAFINGFLPFSLKSGRREPIVELPLKLENRSTEHDKEIGTVFTNGTHLVTDVNQDGFVAIGYIPIGSFESIAFTLSSLNDYDCVYLPGGMKKVQHILAMDKVPAKDRW